MSTTHARPAKPAADADRSQGQRWGVAVVAALPAMLVALAMPLAIEGSLIGFLYAPFVMVVVVVTVGIGAGAGIAVVLLGSVAGALMGPSGASSPILLGAGLAGALLLGTWLGQVLARGSWPLAAALPALALVMGILAMGVTGRLEAGVLAAFTGLSLALLLVLVGPWNGSGAVRPARWAEVLTVAAMAMSALATYAVSVTSAPLVGDSATVSLLGDDQPEGRTDGGLPDPFLTAARWQLEPTWATATLFSISAPEELALRPTWATFSNYNGIAWFEPPTYGVSGEDIPPEAVGAPAESFETAARVTVAVGMLGQWVPVPQRVDQVLSNVATRVDPASGIVAAVGSPIDHAFDARYSLAVADREQVESTFPAQNVGVDPAVALPAPLAGPMAELADEIALQTPDTWSRLVELSKALRGNDYAPAPPAALASGTPDRSYAGLTRVLAEGSGFQEQYAALWALIARSWDVPTRLVIGFPLDAQQVTTRTVLAPQVSVWAEARLDGLGWVAFQPSPQDREAGRPAVVRPLTPAEVPAGPVPGPDSGSGGADDTANPDAPAIDGATPATTASVPWFAMAAVVVAVALVLWLVGVASRRRRIRRRLQVDDPRRSAWGAWQWTRLMLAEAWLPLPKTYAPALDSERPLDLPDGLADEVAHLARLVAPAVYGPEPDAETVRQAWAGADGIARSVRRSTGWRTLARRIWVPLASPPAETAAKTPVGPYS